MTRIALHTHSTCSDGTNTIAENVALALERGLDGIGITDHDTTEGYAAADAAAADTDLRIVHGIEFSAEYDGASLHVLAYGVDPDGHRYDGARASSASTSSPGVVSTPIR